MPLIENNSNKQNFFNSNNNGQKGKDCYQQIEKTKKNNSNKQLPPRNPISHIEFPEKRLFFSHEVSFYRKLDVFL